MNNRQIVVQTLPEGTLTEDNFALQDAPMPTAGQR